MRRPWLLNPAAILIALTWVTAADAQKTQPAQEPEEQTVRNVEVPCLEPPPLIRWEDYEGPLQKVVGSRLLHAAEHVFIAKRDNGRRVFNFSEWLGTTSAVGLNHFYHPGNEPGAGPAAKQVGYLVLEEAGFDVLREFWPEIARALHMPFRGMREPSATGRSPEPNRP